MLEKPVEIPRSKAARAKKKPPTQIAGVSGIDGHGAMGEAPPDTVEPVAPTINWHRLISLPAFEMFVFEQSGLTAYPALSEWVENRRAALGDEKLYELYTKWHEQKGLWLNETPLGREIK